APDTPPPDSPRASHHRAALLPFLPSSSSSCRCRRLKVNTNSTLLTVLGLSSFHFARVFRRETGETPHQFVTRLRLEEAARLLRATDQTVLQVAITVGFENASHFSVQFKRGYGVTPLAYRLRG
ncbi:helix-turn-helix transcriptional regulator, partial [Paraburkholderia elongata]|uniref:helix-turn-helix transcriptional regulator n=1 Tax=Paraburkholderia elongata TaxID=2675747 RepID=UPI001F21336B